MTSKPASAKKQPAKPGRGGAREGAGRKRVGGEEETRLYSIRVPAGLHAWLKAIGAKGVRRVLEREVARIRGVPE